MSYIIIIDHELAILYCFMWERTAMIIREYTGDLAQDLTTVGGSTNLIGYNYISILNVSI